MNNPFDSDSLHGGNSLDDTWMRSQGLDHNYHSAPQSADLSNTSWNIEHSHYQGSSHNLHQPTWNDSHHDSSSDPYQLGSMIGDTQDRSIWQDARMQDLNHSSWLEHSTSNLGSSGTLDPHSTDTTNPLSDYDNSQNSQPQSQLLPVDGNCSARNLPNHGATWTPPQEHNVLSAAASSYTILMSSSSSSNHHPYITIGSANGYVYFNGDPSRYIGSVNGHAINNSAGRQVGYWTTDGKIYDVYKNLKGWVDPSSGCVYATGSNGGVEVYQTTSVTGGAAYLLLVWCGGQT